MGSHLLGIDGLKREEVEYLLEMAESFVEISRRDLKFRCHQFKKNVIK